MSGSRVHSRAPRQRARRTRATFGGREPVILTFCLRVAGVSGCFDQVSFVPSLRMLIKARQMVLK